MPPSFWRDQPQGHPSTSAWAGAAVRTGARGAGRPVSASQGAQSPEVRSEVEDVRRAAFAREFGAQRGGRRLVHRAIRDHHAAAARALGRDQLLADLLSVS